MYKERGDTYPIVANRILHLAAQSQRPYHNRQNLKMLQESFDPIRIRLRVMPSSRAPCAKGMNEDHYFVQACKKAVSGELTSAMDLLKRGLALKPNHFLCKFNHGVVQFKFGLITEACQDFQELTEIHPDESWPYYNLAVCLV